MELERWKILQTTSDYRKSARANNRDTCVRDDSWRINNKRPIVRQKHPKQNIANESQAYHQMRKGEEVAAEHRQFHVSALRMGYAVRLR